MIVDSVDCSFFITEKKKDKVYRTKGIDFKGRISTYIYYPEIFRHMYIYGYGDPCCKTGYISCCNRAISNALVSNYMIRLDQELRAEITHWKFLDT